MPDEPEARGLLALMAAAGLAPAGTRPRRSAWSRSRTRTARSGTTGPDRRGHRPGLADRPRTARTPCRPRSPPATVIAITTVADTDWTRIASLYGTLASRGALAVRRAQPRGGGGDGRRTRPRRWSSWTSSRHQGCSRATTCCRRPGPTCCAGSAARRRPPPRTARPLPWRRAKPTAPTSPGD